MTSAACSSVIRVVVFVLAAFVLASVASSPVLADGVIRDGLGAISIGRGGTNIAHADNAVVILDNPAGMINLAGERLSEVSFDTLFTDLHYTDPQNDVSAEVKPYPMGHFGMIRRDPNSIWAYGFGVYTPAGFGAEWDVVHPNFGLQRQKSFGALVKAMPSVAVRLTDRLSAGGSFGVAVSHIELEGPFHLQSGFPGAPALLDLQGSGAAIAWNAGIQYQLDERLMLGLAYTAETRMRLDGTARATVGGLGSSGFDADVEMAWPRSLGGGMVYKPCCHRRYSVDVLWYDWSSAFDSIDMTLSDASNPIFTGALGNSFRDSFPLNWRDMISVRTGFEHLFSDGRVLRLGYVYHNNPIPESTLTSYIPAILEHAATVGYGWKRCCWNVDVAYQYSWGTRQFVGTSAILGGDFDNSSADSAAHWIAISIGR